MRIPKPNWGQEIKNNSAQSEMPTTAAERGRRESPFSIIQLR
jgi:hypothetical protein